MKDGAADRDDAPLLDWIVKRERIRMLKDSGLPPPWTDDPVLGTFRFCNVRREDDRVTVWIRENVRERFEGHPHLWFMLCVARQINWPDTLAELIEAGAWPSDPQFDPSAMTRVLNARKARGEKVYTGAYMISAPATKGADKQRYIAEDVCGALWKRRDFFESWFAGGTTRAERNGFGPTLQGTHERISRSSGWGHFMAYQAVIDMRFTPLLEKAPDVDRWAAAGPGTIRGLNRLHGREVDARLGQEAALSEMRAIWRALVETGVVILGAATASRAYRLDSESMPVAISGIAMDFSDVPNVLCETDKYLRVALGEGKPRALYVPGRGA